VISRRRPLSLLTILTAAAPPRSPAQEIARAPGRLGRIGLLGVTRLDLPVLSSERASYREAFRDEPQRLGGMQDRDQKDVEFPKDLLSAISRVSAFADPTFFESAPYRAPFEAARTELRTDAALAVVTKLGNLATTIERRVASQVQAVCVYGSGVSRLLRHEIGALARSTGLPDVYIFRVAVAEGALKSYRISYDARTRRAADDIDQIPGNVKAAEPPIELPTTCERAISRRTASAPGLNIPQSSTLRADEVID
jgi:hypothetical protein